MSVAAIQAEGLSKRYRVGAAAGPYRTLRESIVDAAKAPLRRLRRQSGGRREEFWALRGVSFEVAHGEVLGVIGRNGAGKSTLLKILSSITEPTAGEVRIEGRVASLLEVGTGFHPELTGRENVYLNGAILGMRRAEIDRKFNEIVAFAEVERFIDTPVKRYSSGMYLRLAFAVAAHLEPEVLLVDEVLAVGDAAFQRKCLGRMSEVAREGRTVLFVTHNLAAVEALCHTCLLLDKGSLVTRGATREAVGRYLELMKTGSEWAGEEQATDAPVGLRGITLRSEASPGIQTGDPVRIEMALDVKQPCRSLYVGVGVMDDWDRLVFAFHAMEAGLVLDGEIAGELTVSIEVPRLLLLPGSYHLRVRAADSRNNLYLDVPAAVSFEVLPRDYSGHGHPFTREHGLAIIPFRMAAECDGRSWSTVMVAG